MKCEWCGTELRQSAHVPYCPHCGRAAGTIPLHPMQHVSDVMRARVDRSVATHKLLDREVRQQAVTDYIRKIKGGRD